MTITQLRCFIAMAEELSFTHAAKKLYISQTAVTYHIKALEKELGTDLFVRTTRKVILSEVGKQFYRDVREAVQTIDTAYESVRKNNKKKHFRLATPHCVMENGFRRSSVDLRKNSLLCASS